MRRTLFALPLALWLAACGDCDCCKKNEAPAAAPKETAATTPAAATSTPAGGALADGTETAPAPFALDADDPPPRVPPEVKVAWRGEGTTLEFSVWEMHCAGCEKRVEDALEALPGVTAATSNYVDSTVKVTLADASKRAALIETIRTTLAATEFRLLGE